MARTALEPFVPNKISFKVLSEPDDKLIRVRARARYRRENGGPLHDVYATGEHEAKHKDAARKAEDKADQALRKRLRTIEGEHRGGSDQVKSTSTVEQVAQVWLDEKRAQRPALAPKTLEGYERWTAAYVTGTAYGRLRISDAAKAVRGEQHLRAVANGEHRKGVHGGEGAMRSARKVLHGVFDTAERHGAISGRVRLKLQGRSVDDDRRRVDTERAFTRDELREIQRVADQHPGDVGDLVAFLRALGPRLTEALRGVWWDDLDLDSGVVVIKGTKSKNAVRTVEMPSWLTERLARRAERYGTKGLVFGVTRYPSKLGQPRDTTNMTHTLRKVLDDAGCPWAASHTFRRTVATLMDDGGEGTGAIATVLGQVPAVTATYIKRAKVGTAAASVFADDDY